jgi:ferredoxin-nitrite reductase
MSQDFSAEQKRYLEGFVAGAAASQVVGAAAPAAAVPSGPDAPHLLAQDAQVKAGAKLAEPEKWKRDEHPFDAWQRLTAEAATGKLPGPADNFRWRYFGLFNVAPAQDSFMLRMRLPNGILKAHQLAGCARLAETYGGGVLAVTTRANLQMREIRPENAKALIEELMDLGIVARGSGADNIRNVTGSPLAGIDPQELLDTRPLARDWHFHILNSRVLYGLPRKFNVSFDGAGLSPALEETNDIGFQAVRVPEGGAAEPGIWLRIALGGISGHRDLARPTGAFCRPEEATAVADAIIRVFIDHGDRTNRNRARLKYVLDAWGFDRFLAAVEEKLGRPLLRIAEAFVAPRPSDGPLRPCRRASPEAAGPQLGRRRHGGRQAHAPAGRGSRRHRRRMRRRRRRLTVWQNLILSGVPDAQVPECEARIAALGLSTTVTPIRAGLVACTGNAGCKFAAADTKRHAMAIADHCRGAGRHRCAGEHPPDRLPPFLRPALYRRYRPDRRPRAGQRRRRHGGGLRHRGGRRLRRECTDRPDAVEGRQGRGRTAPRGGAASAPISGTAHGPAEGFQAFTLRHDAEALEGLVAPHLSPLKEAAE